MLRWIAVESQVLVDLVAGNEKGGPDERPCNGLCGCSLKEQEVLGGVDGLNRRDVRNHGGDFGGGVGDASRHRLRRQARHRRGSVRYATTTASTHHAADGRLSRYFLTQQIAILVFENHSMFQ